MVKNAAGFDLPKLMVGSLGRLGVMVELSLKVFPRPEATATVCFPTVGLSAGLAAIAALARGPVSVSALDLAASGAVTVRTGGSAELIQARACRLAHSVEPVGELIADEATQWDRARRFDWVGAEERLVVIPTASRQIAGLDADLERRGLNRRYGLAANVAWVGWPKATPVTELSQLLAAHALTGVVLTGAPLPKPLLGAATGGAFARRITGALDPANVFAGDAP